MIRRSGFEVDGANYEAVVNDAFPLPRVTLRREGLHAGTFHEVARCLWLGDRLSPGHGLPRRVLEVATAVVRTELQP